MHSGDGQGTSPQAYAGRLLAAVQVPPGATPSNHAPSKALDSLPESPSLDRTPLVVKRFWTVDDSALASYGWLTRHTPTMPLDNIGRSGSTTTTRTTEQYLGFRATALPASIGAGYLYLSVVATGPHTAAIGAYAVTLRQPPRPAVERVPLDGTRVVVRWALAEGGTPALKSLTGSAATQLVRDFDALRVDTTGKTMCPMIPQQDANITVTFTTSGRSWKATIPSCPDIAVTRDGQPLPALAFATPFLNDVRSVTGYLPRVGPPGGAGGVTPLVQPRAN